MKNRAVPRRWNHFLLMAAGPMSTTAFGLHYGAMSASRPCGFNPFGGKRSRELMEAPMRIRLKDVTTGELPIGNQNAWPKMIGAWRG